eukprot:431306_1
MDLLNIMHHSIDSPLVLNVMVISSLFRGMLLHINEIRSSDIHFCIFVCGGNEHQWTIVSLTAEVSTPANVPVEQDQKIYFCKIAGFGHSLRIGERISEAKYGIKRTFGYFTISGNYGWKMMENKDMDFNIGFEKED